MSRGKLRQETQDEWAELVQEASDEYENPGAKEGRVGLFEAIKRFFVLMFWRPVSTIAYTLGLVYGSICIRLFAHGDMLEAYGEVDVVNRIMPPKETIVVSEQGIYMLLIWLIVPPIWFFIESYVLCKTPEQRALVKEAQEISVKVWLALLGVMAILAK